MSNIDLDNHQIYDVLNDDYYEHMVSVSQSAAAATTAQKNVDKIEKVERFSNTYEPKKLKRSFWGFIKFALIVIFIVVVLYLVIDRIGWGVQECMKKNYHDCAALLTPELAPLVALAL